MSENDSKLCRICLNSGTDNRISATPSLNKFFSHILGIQEPPLTLWLCIWCKSVLQKTMKMIRLAEASQKYLSNAKKINGMNKFNKENVITLSYHHNVHYDIPPEKKTKLKHKTNKSKNIKLKEIQFVNLKEAKDVNETIVKDETQDDDDIELEEVKIEVNDVELSIDDDNDTHNDSHQVTNEHIKTEKPKRKINPKLIAKCEENNFTLKVLTFEEQMAELEEKRKSEKYLSRKYKCEYCGIGFVTKDVFEEHKKRHQESHSPHECPLCHLRFSNSLVLSQHQLAHERRFTCRLCQAVITRYSDCDNHRLKCGQATPGVCPHCKKIFSNQNSLEQHIRGVHYKKEKKFVCSYCNQRFQSKQRHAIHTRTHTGAKPYTCDLCHRSFAANSNLRSHLSAHAQARPHYCVECDKSYKTRKGLRRHLLEGATHLRRAAYSCHHCLKDFTSEKLLASHINSSHTKEPDSCGLCNKTFSNCANLSKHIQNTHESPITT